MSNIKCLIVDDEPKAREVLDIYLQDHPELNLIAQCRNAIEAINIMASQKIDLIFLDIEMPEISGLALAKTLNKNTSIIFTTAFRDYAVDGFDLRAIDYLLKPIRPERFKEAIEKYKAIRAGKGEASQKVNSDNHLFVRSDRKMIKIILGEILYIESLSDYLKIHTKKGLIITRETLTSIHEKLHPDQFLRIHRSFIVNCHHLRSFTKETVLINDIELPISRSYRTKVNDQLMANSPS
ncbi:LytTR family DNA-binding domain-containing protein [Roseivirga sp. E12]|uniref:LytR/AlgR family response regulator transcription factor n=1 Tax=Roseivirga sp. E12 TaxID=2819237 RepID=UPI001ABCE1B2|nr:LytTR family DNA-binding domain-containing protein [Roseivirga sp. E12]MBO3697946.1 response regulator transcription factor [Roseivirga sp. E12]